MLQLIGGATLAVQTVVLGASLFQKVKKQQRAPEQAERSDARPSTSQAASADSRIQSLSPTGMSKVVVLPDMRMPIAMRDVLRPLSIPQLWIEQSEQCLCQLYMTIYQSCLGHDVATMPAGGSVTWSEARVAAGIGLQGDQQGELAAPHSS